MAALCAGTPWTHCAAGDRYVVKGNPGAAAPYESWATAAGDIQTAVDAAAEGKSVRVRSSARWPFLAQRSYRSAGETVWVRAGVYDAGGKSDVIWRAKLTNRVAIAKSIVVRSENNDPANTIIKGAWSADGCTNGPGAVRCAYVADGAALIGFTLAGGATLTTNEAWADNSDRSGGGVYAQSSMAVISNCIITGNSAFGDRGGTARGGGGACGGKFFNCVFTSNTTPFRGGGADHVILFNCVLSGNSAAMSGGGVHVGALYGCVVSNNTTSGSGGGLTGWSAADPCKAYDSDIIANRAGEDGGGAASHTALANCRINFNKAATTGGGANNASLIDCELIGNRTDQSGGGAYGCSLRNCTLAFNVAAAWGGGANASSLNNCLIYGNQAGEAGGVYGASLNSCTVVGNYAARAGGVAYYGSNANVISSIIYSNQVSGDYPNWCGSGISFTNSCTFPANAAWSAGNTTNDPCFIAYGAGYGTNHVPGDYRLASNSPCASAGFKREHLVRKKQR